MHLHNTNKVQVAFRYIQGIAAGEKTFQDKCFHVHDIVLHYQCYMLYVEANPISQQPLLTKGASTTATILAFQIWAHENEHKTHI